MADNKPSTLPVILFIDQPSFEAWLDERTSEDQGVLIKIAKKGSGVSSISYDEAVESALCYGWIDSQASSLDEQFYLQKFSPRKRRSKWSKLNTEKAEALIASGRMRPPGLLQVELARQDGRWAAAYDPQSEIVIPDDFLRELDKNPNAKEFYQTLNSINRYAILYRIQDAKKPETRAARIKKFVDMLADKKKFYP